MEALIQLLEKPLDCNFYSKPWRLLFSFQKAQEKKEEPVRGSSVLTQLGAWLPTWPKLIGLMFLIRSPRSIFTRMEGMARHGKAWGVVHKDDAPKKISGIHKRCWRYIRHLSKPGETTPSLMKPTENAPKPEAQVA